MVHSIVPASVGKRTEADYRLFTEDVGPDLYVIRQAETLASSIEEIKDILDLRRGGEQPCAGRSLFTACRATTARRFGFAAVEWRTPEQASAAQGRR